MKMNRLTGVFMLLLVMMVGTGTLFAQGAREVASNAYLGQIESIQRMAGGVNYELLVKDANGNNALFRTTDQTEATLPLASLDKGDYVEVGYNGIMTRSIPPQATADSVRWITALVNTGIIDLQEMSSRPAAQPAAPSASQPSADHARPSETATVVFGTRPVSSPAPEAPVATATPAPAETSGSATAPATPATTVPASPDGRPTTPPAVTAPPATAAGQSVMSTPIQIDENTYLYRGTVISKSEADNNGNIALLVQAVRPGIGYGESEIRFILGPNTTGDLATVKVGDYVEVTHGPAMTMSIPPQTSAFSVKVLLNPSIVTANAVYLGKMFDGKDFKSGSILVLNLANEQEEIYLFDADTVINLNIFDLPVGSHISLFHRGTMTRSYPAQGFAYCIDYTYGE